MDKNIELSPPFFITLTIHEKMLHNFLLDSGELHNLMPKVVMEYFGISVINPFHYLYYFDSKVIKCLGVIKYLVSSLTQLSMKSILMDIVVGDILPKFSMLLSRSWTKTLGGSLQMELTYANLHF